MQVKVTMTFNATNGEEGTPEVKDLNAQIANLVVRAKVQIEDPEDTDLLVSDLNVKVETRQFI